ncbi:hypothetical protein [Geoalkalibacter halelectricus]|uniref:hypothetical protein n=1 Tax=Geoalkalibacter halelectricus TaxID=2847045 RepID=UPI003D2459C8
MEIKLEAWAVTLPDEPRRAAPLTAWIDVHPDFPGENEPVLKLGIGDIVIRVWPADPARIRALGEQLLQLVAEAPLETREETSNYQRRSVCG